MFLKNRKITGTYRFALDTTEASEENSEGLAPIPTPKGSWRPALHKPSVFIAKILSNKQTAITVPEMAAIDSKWEE